MAQILTEVYVDKYWFDNRMCSNHYNKEASSYNIICNSSYNTHILPIMYIMVTVVTVVSVLQEYIFLVWQNFRIL